MDKYHTSVLLQEAVDNLQVIPGGMYIDATLGGGGHTREILKRGGKVLGIDQDMDAIQHFDSILRDKDIRIVGKEDKDSPTIVVSQYPNITVVHGNFENIHEIAVQNGITEVSGILMDLGVSGHHFDTGERGFSFMSDAPLDMRMDQTKGSTASDLVNGLTQKELEEVFYKFGEERNGRRIAQAIVSERKTYPITTTKQLAELIKKNTRGFEKIHPATRVFQALRIAVNDELHVLQTGLIEGIKLLSPKGRFVVISFHSLEDRIVKHLFQEFEKEGKGKIIAKKPIIATDEEVSQNSRSRSAKLRVFEIL